MDATWLRGSDCDSSTALFHSNHHPVGIHCLLRLLALDYGPSLHELQWFSADSFAVCSCHNDAR
jgi:hypothetical protein